MNSETGKLNKSIGVFGLRLIIGLIFLMQGYGKVFTIGVEELYNAPFFKGAFEGVLPLGLVKFTAYFTSYVELIAGLLLVLGLFRYYAIYSLILVLVIVSYGHGLIEPIWDLQHVVFRALLLIPLLFLPSKWDRFCLDSLLFKWKSKA